MNYCFLLELKCCQFEVTDYFQNKIILTGYEPSTLWQQNQRCLQLFRLMGQTIPLGKYSVEWNIVNDMEMAQEDRTSESYVKFCTRRDRALATIVLSVEPSLLYLVGNPEDPVAVWKKLSDQFQKKTWANRLVLRQRLHSLRLKDGDSVQEHVKAMTELFIELSVIGDEVTEEDRVVYLLASLPDSYNTCKCRSSKDGGRYRAVAV